MGETDFFADIAMNLRTGDKKSLMISPPVEYSVDDLSLSEQCSVGSDAISYEKKVIQFRENLHGLKELYRPFLADFTPKADVFKRKFNLTVFQFRYESLEDRKNISNVMAGGGEWENVRLPDYRGPVGKWNSYYRTVFHYERPFQGRKVFLKFLGVDYIANVYVNNRFIGSHEGFFSAFEFDITDSLIADEENVLVVEVKNDIPTIGIQDRTLNGDKIYACTGLGWDDPDEGWHHCPPGAGIYDQVFLEERTEVFVDSIFIRPDIDNACIEARIQVYNTKVENSDIKLDLSIYPRNFQAEPVLNVPIKGIEPAGPGMNYYRINLGIPDYRLWQCDEPWLYTARVRLQPVTLDVKTAGGEAGANGEKSVDRADEDGSIEKAYGEESIDEMDAVFGMRKFHMDEEPDGMESSKMDEKTHEKGSLYLNNQPIFLRGANDMGHMQQCVMNEDFEQLTEDILIAKLANMNYYRFTQRPVQQEIYQYCDMLGMMNQTDLPLFGYLRRNQFCEALRQTGEMERHIRNHPSAIMVTYINEPFPVIPHKMGHRHLYRDELEAFFEAADRVVKVENPDRVIKHVEGDYDPPTGTGLSDFHCYNLWYTNHAIPFGKLYKGYLPALKKGWKTGCGEYGTEGLDSYDVMLRHYPKGWLPDRNSEKWVPGQIVQSQTNGMHGDWYEEQDNIADWIKESQKHQAFATKVMTDALRRRSDRIVSTAVHLLIDAWPAGWMKALVGVDRVPKPAYFSFKDSLEPVRVHLRCDRWKVYSGETIEVEVWGLNDRPCAFQGCRIIATLRDDAMNYASYEMTCDIKAACSRRIGNLKLQIPDISDRKVLYIDVQLQNNQDKIINIERLHIEVFERIHKMITTGKALLATIGEDARKVMDSLAIPSVHPDELLQLSREKANCILISDLADYEKCRQQVERFVENGGTAIFMDPINTVGTWEFAGTAVRFRNIIEGFYIDGIDSQAVNGIYFAAMDSGQAIIKGFEPDDFSYLYNSGSEMIDFITARCIECKKLLPILYTYKKPGFTERMEANKVKLPILGSMNHGKGKVYFTTLCLDGRVGVNPVLDRLIVNICCQ